MSYEDFIEESHRLRLDGIEMTLYWVSSKELSYYRNLKRLSLLRGLPISCAGISTNFCNPDISEREKQVRSVEEGLNMAHQLGASCLRVFGGYVPQGYSETEATRWVVESLKSSVRYAEDRGVVIALENHGGVTARADNVVNIVKGVDSPWFGVNLDLGNYKESTYDEIAKTIPYTVHIHGKVSLAEGVELDYQRIKKILRDGGYNGFLSIEYEEKEDAKTGVPRFAEYLFGLFG